MSRCATTLLKRKTLTTLPDVRPALSILADVKLKHFAAEANTLDVARMDALIPTKRITLLAAVVSVQTTRAYDDLAEMFVKRMLAIHQKAKEALVTYQTAQQSQADTLIRTLRDLLVAFQGTGTADERLHGMAETLPASADHVVTACDAYLAYSGNNYYPFMWGCYRTHRPTLFRILTMLTFESTSQNSDFLAALAFLQANEQSKGDWLMVYHDVQTDQGMRYVPIIPLTWVPEGWWRLLTDQHTTTPPPHRVRRRHFEVCVFAHLMAELKSGDIAIIGSDAYADYRTQLIDWAEYDQTVADYGQMLGFPIDGPAFTAHVQAQLRQQAQETDAVFPTLTEVHLEAGEPVVRRAQRRPEPPGLKPLEEHLAATLKPVNILDVIRYTEHWLHWIRPFGPISGHDGKLTNPTARYVATVFCYGCNLGPTQTARGIAGLDRKQVAWPNQRHITEDSLEAAIQIIINAYHQGTLPKHWGTGKTASADGTKWDVYEQNLLAEYHIRYGGYGGIGYYHVSDTYIALFSHFIPCGVWEAIYILDGLLKNESDIQPDTIHADTQGQSAPVFALAYLLGISLMPRIRNWKHLTFFRPKSTDRYTHIDDLFSETINWKLIETHLPDMLRVVLSIKAGRITAATILRRLSTYNQHNRLYQAFRELGRAVRTHFLLMYLRDGELRSTIHAALNKSEAFNNFIQWIAFGGDGVLASNDRAVQRKLIKYNHLVANCTIFYNAVVISQALHDLQAAGVVIDAEAIAAISPLITGHIDRFGSYPSDETDPPPFDEALFHGSWLPAPILVHQKQRPSAAPLIPPANGQLGFDGLVSL